MKARSVPRYLARKVDFRLRHIHIARGSFISNTASIGSYVNINARSFVADCEIGPYCDIGGRLVVHCANHYTNRANMQVSLQSKVINSSVPIWGLKKERVSIGAASWIGDSVIIVPGGSVGIGAVVGAGSVVTKPIPDFAVAVGNPARVIKMRFSPAVIDYLLRVAWWEWDIERIRRNRPFFEIDFHAATEEELGEISIVE